MGKKSKKDGIYAYVGFLWWLSNKESACQCRRTELYPGAWKDPLEKEMATHSSLFALKIPWTERPGGLQFIGLQTVGHDRATKHSTSQSIAYSFCHTAETNKTLGSNYPPIKKKKLKGIPSSLQNRQGGEESVSYGIRMGTRTAWNTKTERNINIKGTIIRMMKTMLGTLY